jgi:hypothetical protein
MGRSTRLTGEPLLQTVATKALSTILKYCVLAGAPVPHLGFVFLVVFPPLSRLVSPLVSGICSSRPWMRTLPTVSARSADLPPSVGFWMRSFPFPVPSMYMLLVCVGDKQRIFAATIA